MGRRLSGMNIFIIKNCASLGKGVNVGIGRQTMRLGIGMLDSVRFWVRREESKGKVS